MERDLTFVWAWIAAAVFLAIGMYLHRRRGQIEAMHEERRSRERAAVIRKGVTAGTHTESGKPVCRIEGCRNSATLPDLRALRDDRTLKGWLRTLVGAPVRWRVVDAEPRAYCSSCAPLCRTEFEAFLVAKEQKRLERVRDDEVEISRFERIGLEERVNARVSEHDQRVRPSDQGAPSNVRVLARS